MHKGVAKVIATIAKAVSKKVNNSTPKTNLTSTHSSTSNNSTPKTNLNSTHNSSTPAKGKAPGKK